MATPDLSGMGVALVTPFNNDKSIDFPALDNLVDFIIAGGADYIVVLGTTAETPTLSLEERMLIRARVVAKTAGRVPLVLGVGGYNTSEVTHQLLTDDLSDFCAILSVVPYYNKPTQKGIFEHYKAIAEASPVPVIMYNVPGRTGSNMLPETAIRLAQDFPKIVAIKAASGNVAQISTLLADKPDDFTVISGDDSLTLPLMALGASGVISVIGNVCPDRFSEMVHLCLNGEFDKAREIHRNLLGLIRMIFIEGNPAGIKAALHASGYINNELRLPLVPVSEELADKIKESMQQLKA